MLQRRPRPARRDARWFAAPVEALETRRLLCSTHLAYLPPAPKWSDAVEQASRAERQARGGPEAIDIVWTNRGQASDNFGLAFGTSAEAGRRVVDAAIAAWERVITSFNRADGTNTLQLTISIATDAMGNLVGGFGGAGGPAAAAPADGKPRTGSITINAGTIGGTPNDSNGWFFDATPDDYSEFTGAILNPFAGNPGSIVGGELYSVVAAELTHTLGFISPKAGGAGSNWVGYELVDSGFTQPTGQRDNAEGGGSSGYYYVFNGPSVSHAMTSFNSGDPDDDSWGNVIHTAGGTANFTHNAVNYRGTDDDGNAASGGERTLPSWVTANILKDAYGYTIVNPARFGTMMAILNQTTGRLTVRGIDNSSDTIFITSNGVTTTVHVDLGTDFPGSGFRPGAGNLDAWISEFPAASVQSITIDAGTGDDVVNLDLPGSIPITVSGGAGGNDLLLIKGSAGYDSVTVDFPLITSTALNVQSFSDFEQLRIDTRTGNADLYLTDLLGSMTGVTVQGDSGNETINLRTLEAGKPAVFFMGSGNDTVNVQVDPGVGLVASPVTINGFDGNDTVNVGPVDFAGTIVTQPITFNGDAGNDTMVIGSNNADSLAANVAFNGGSHVGGLNDRLIVNDQAPSYGIDYDVATTFVRRTGLSTRDLGYAGTEEIIINGGAGADSVVVRNGVSPIVRAFGNGGNDNFTRGDGMITASSGAQFDGGPGIDQITFDDRNNPGNIIFDCRQGEVFYGGLIIQQTTGFESVGILAGTGVNEITFNQTLTQNFNVDAGPGGDNIIFGFNGGTAVIQGTVNVQGGDGSDSFVVNNCSTSGAGSITLNGGNSLNSLSVTRPGTIVYDLGATLDLYSFGSELHIAASNFDATTINGNALNETFNVFAASSVFGLYRIFGGDGADAFLVQPGGSPHAFDNLYCNGGNGNDSFTFAGDAVAGDQVYRIGNNAVRIDNGILSTDIYVETNVENVVVRGGGGNDAIFVDQYSAGSSLSVAGGGGDDVFRVGGNNFQANLTNASAFSVDGQAGNDQLRIENAANANPWTYRITTNSVLTETPLTSPITPATYSWFSAIAGLEKITVNAGPAGDAMRISSLGSGVGVDFNAAAGVDQLFLGEGPLNIGLIAGPIFFDTGANAGRVVITDHNATSAKTVHMDANSVGAYPGDNLFGAGGSLRFTELVDVSTFFPAFSLSLGAFADTVFAQPLATGRVSVDGRAPTTSPGDTLNLALAGAQNYAVTPGTPGSGTVTSANLQPLSWVGIEGTPVVDDTAPAVVANDFNFNPGAPRGPAPMAFAATFSEDVSAFLTPSFLELLNATTNQPVPAGDIAVAWDAATLTATFTFPNYPGGLLPDGVYQARVLGGLVDPFGNAGGDGPFYTFVWSGGTAGDDVLRVALDPTTLDHQVFLNDDATPAFLAGPGTAKIVLAGREGGDRFTIDATGGNPVTPDGVAVFGGDGGDTLAVVGSAAADDALFDGTQAALNGSTVSHTGMEAYAYDGAGGFDTLAISGVPVGFASTQRFAALMVGAGASAAMPSTAGAVLVVQDLTVDAAGRVDLGGSAMIWDYAGTSPVAAVRELLTVGRNGGGWDGLGIASSAAAIDPRTGIGYAEAADLFSTFPATFAGEEVDDSAVLLRFTLLGDADLNQAVGIADFARLASNFNQTGSEWSRGDFDYDGVTGIADFSSLASNFNQVLARPDVAGALRAPTGAGFSVRRIAEAIELDSPV